MHPQTLIFGASGTIARGPQELRSNLYSCQATKPYYKSSVARDQSIFCFADNKWATDAYDTQTRMRDADASMQYGPDSRLRINATHDSGLYGTLNLLAYSIGNSDAAQHCCAVSKVEVVRKDNKRLQAVR